MPHSRSKLYPIFATLLLLSTSSPTLADTALRDFSDSWLYRSGKIKDARFPDYVDTYWTQLEEQSRPDSASSEQPNHHWYRKHFTLPQQLETRSISLILSPSELPCKIYLNGHDLGTYESDALPFACELSPYLRFGTDEVNVLALLLINEDHESLAFDPLRIHETAKLKVD